MPITIPNKVGIANLGVVAVKGVKERHGNESWVNVGANKAVVDDGSWNLSAGETGELIVDVISEDDGQGGAVLVAYIHAFHKRGAGQSADTEKPKASSTGIKLPTAVGTHNLGTVTILGIEEANKSCNWIAIGADKSLKSWKKNNFSTELTEGATGEMVIEVKETEWQGESRLEFWVKSFGGDKPKGGGGGGSRGYTPKSAAEIHSSSICGILKSAIEFHPDGWKKVAEEAIGVYEAAIKRLSGGDK